MAKKTIDELADGESIRESTAVVAFQQGSTTFKGSAVPVSENTEYISNQAQLESIFGSLLIIPTDTNVTLEIIESFTMTTHFQIGDDATLQLHASPSGTEIFWDGTGALFQNQNPTNEIDGIRLLDVNFDGNGTNSLFDIKVGANSAVIIEDASFGAFDRIGILEQGILAASDSVFTSFTNGILHVSATSDFIDNILFFNFSGTPTTMFTFQGGNPNVSISNCESTTIVSGDAFFFFDPNSATASFVVSGCKVSGQDFYQTGSDISVTSVTDNSGQALFNNGGDNLLTVGQAVVLTGFGVYTNATYIVTAATATTFEVGLGFGGNDTGTINESSLDQTDNRVTARNNPGQSQSMAQAEGRSGNAISFVAVVSTFTPLQDTTPTAGDFVQDVATERFTVDTSTGLITYTGISPLSATISFEFTISKDGGGTDTGTVSLFQTGSQQIKTDKLLSITTTVQDVSYSGGLFVISPNDTFQLEIDNDAASTINITNVTMLVSQQ